MKINLDRRLASLLVLAAGTACAQEPALEAGRGAPMVFAVPTSGPGPSARFRGLIDSARLSTDLVVPQLVESAEYRRTFKILLSHPEKTDRYDRLIAKYARLYRLDPRFLKAIMAAESEFDPKAVSPAGARGLMQVMPVTAAGVGVRPRDLTDPEAGIKAGAAYFQFLFKDAWKTFHLQGVRYTDVPYWVQQRVIAAYHAGPKSLTRDHWHATTRSYVRKVVLFYHSDVADLRRAATPSLASR